MRRIAATVAMLVSLFFAAVADARPPARDRAHGSDNTSQPDQVIQWNRTLLQILQTQGAQPATVHPTRSMAITQLAVYDAVNAIDGRYAPYLRQHPAPRAASPDAAAAAAGASGFLLKDAPAEELVQAVRVVAAGDALVSPSVMRRLIADFVAQPTRLRADPVSLDVLTPREREVLRLIARGLSNAEISTALVVAPQTTKTHVGHILRKLNLRDRVQAVVVAYETGLVTPRASPANHRNARHGPGGG